MRTIILILAVIVIAGCAAPSYKGGKGGVPFHDDPDVRLVEGVIQLDLSVVEDALEEGADIYELHDLSSIPRFWATVGKKKEKYTPLGALLRTSRSSELNRRLYEEKQYTEILNLLLKYGLDPNSRLGQSGDEDITLNAFGEYSFLRGPSATLGIPLLYKKGLELDKALFKTRSFSQAELKILRNKQPAFWLEMNDKFENVLVDRLYGVIEH